MKKHEWSEIPFIAGSQDFCDFAHVTDCFDPLGSYTGRTPERDDVPVQDADDL